MADQPVPSEIPEEVAQSSSNRKKGTNTLIILIGGLLLFMVVGAVFVMILLPSLVPAELNVLGSRRPSLEGKGSDTGNLGYLYSLDPIVINLADAEPMRYLKIRIEIESHERKASEEYQRRLPQMRDAILTLLASKGYKEIYDAEGKKKLKEEIVQKANQLLGHLKVKTVYFTEFVIQ